MNSFKITACKDIDVLATVQTSGGGPGAIGNQPRIPSNTFRQDSFTLLAGESRGGFCYFNRVRTRQASETVDWSPPSSDPADQEHDAESFLIQEDVR